MRIIALVQARLNSIRFPNKVMKEINKQAKATEKQTRGAW